MNTVDLSVIVCTLNRSALLGKCLDSLAQQEKGSFTFETIVVDNGSTDDTKRVTESLSSRLTGLRYVREPRTGLARARQTGLEVSVGNYVAYIDDDAMADRRWCSSICAAFREAEQSREKAIAALGGPIDPAFETAKPSWLTGELTALYAIVDLGSQRRAFPGTGCPIGANMAFLRAVLMENPWDTGLLMCEEIHLFARLRDRGFEFLYVPGMKVEHFISAARLTPSWILKRYFEEGMAHECLPLGVVRKTRVAIAAFVKFPFLLLLSGFGSEGQRLKYRCKRRFYRGYLAALLGRGELDSTEYLSARRRAAF